MSEENAGGMNKPAVVKNSLLSAAATGFSFEDAPALLVPVSLQDEPDVEPMISEIDLMSEDLAEELDAPLIMPSTSDMIHNTPAATSDVDMAPHGHINLFTTSNLGNDLNDPFTLMISSSSTSVAPVEPPLVASEGLRESRSSDTLFSHSLSSLWSAASGRMPAPTGQRVSPVTQSESNAPSGVVPGGLTNTYVPQGSTESVPGNLISDSTNVASSFPYSVSSPNLLSQAKDGREQPPLNQQVQNGPPSLNKSLPPTGGPPKGNNFRMSNQRPVYAQYPGLTGTHTAETNILPMQPLPNATVPSQPVTTFVPRPTSQYTPYEGLLSTMPTSAFYPNRPGPPPAAGSTEERHQPQIGTFSIPARNLAHHHEFIYSPVAVHWFHRKDVDGRPVWKPFSVIDSVALEEAFTNNVEDLIATDGGRYDVDVKKRQKSPIYWEEAPSEVKRCSWFYKGPMDSRFIPYDEELCQRLENEYQQAMTTGVWHKRLEFPGGEAIVLHNPNAMAHFCQAAAPDEWGNLPESQIRPRVVKRGVEEFEIEDGESKQIDHLVFLVHGIGAICDFKFRTIVEAVDDFRHLSVQLMHSHFKDSVDKGRAGRIEFLPVSWHKALHGDGGIDQKLKPITLKSIPKLRNFTNDTLLDILFYTSPVYAQTIVDTVGNELNRLFNLFLTRNPTFNGYVALSGHSLGSLILFDLLAHQPKIGRHGQSGSSNRRTSDTATDKLGATEIKTSMTSLDSTESSSSRMVSYTIGSGTGQPVISYPTLEFEPTAFFALGSPIAMFVTVRGIDKLGEKFHFPTCPAFFNIFHPYDPVAYRIETLIDSNHDMRPVVIPHHKGRKRFHLELKETMQRVGSDIKQKFLESLKTTWNTVYQLATFSKGENFEQEMERVIEGELVKKSEDTASNASGEDGDQDVGLGKLNGGRRIDYVLQEAPLESFNEYLFALSSHVCYWESEDTMLMIMKEIYASMGILPDSVAVPKRSHSPQYQAGSMESYTTSMYHQGGVTYNNYPPVSTSYPEPMIFTPSVPLSSQVFSTPIGQSNSTAPPLFLNPNATESNPNWSNPPIIPPPLTSAIGTPKIIGARPVVSPDSLSDFRGMDPTAPITDAPTNVGPPPLTGFVRKL